ncbi:YbdD/YjiX family protein [Streptomyces sp. TRM 70351]|uniref:YbdD/YjiX family protein n=1 Tax=Streptomyces sp. TRM 70351 TaxID=3116552 RepID=UPI002E7AC30E|nr:YbdD/YjiX family protein [Streptomyces sp. TRM 70351]MEE1927656.1 YbdD/YjiX family protein [Streptomyces sp. TRM 70351]
MTAAARLAGAAARLRWYWRELTGEAAYDRYVAHVRAHDPGAPVPTRRAFERWRTDAREADPREGFRCC